MYGYGQQGPAQWAGQQNRQQYNSMQNLVNMLMQVKMMKHRETVDQGRWDQQQELQERELASLDKDRRTREKRLSTPTMPDYMQKAMLLGKHPADTQAGQNLRKALNIKNPEEEMAIFKKKEEYKAQLKQQYKDPLVSDTPAGKQDKQVTADGRLISSAIRRLTSSKSKADTKAKPTTNELEYGTFSEQTKLFRQQAGEEANNYSNALDILYRMEGYLGDQTPLGPENRALVKRIMRDTEGVKTGSIFEELALGQQGIEIPAEVKRVAKQKKISIKEAMALYQKYQQQYAK